MADIARNIAPGADRQTVIHTRIAFAKWMDREGWIHPSKPESPADFEWRWRSDIEGRWRVQWYDDATREWVDRALRESELEAIVYVSERIAARG